MRKVIILLFLNIYVKTGTNLRRAATFAVDNNVRAAVTKLKDHKVLSKLACGDMYPLDAYYHPSCLATLYNRVRNFRPSKEQEDSELSIFSSFFGSYCFSGTSHVYRRSFKAMVFQLSDLAKMFSCLLEQLRGHVPGRVNSTGLTDRQPAQIPALGKVTWK